MHSRPFLPTAVQMLWLKVVKRINVVQSLANGDPGNALSKNDVGDRTRSMDVLHTDISDSYNIIKHHLLDVRHKHGDVVLSVTIDNAGDIENPLKNNGCHVESDHDAYPRAQAKRAASCLETYHKCQFALNNVNNCYTQARQWTHISEVEPIRTLFSAGPLTGSQRLLYPFSLVEPPLEPQGQSQQGTDHLDQRHHELVHDIHSPFFAESSQMLTGLKRFILRLASFFINGLLDKNRKM